MGFLEVTRLPDRSGPVSIRQLVSTSSNWLFGRISATSKGLEPIGSDRAVHNELSFS